MKSFSQRRKSQKQPFWEVLQGKIAKTNQEKNTVKLLIWAKNGFLTPPEQNLPYIYGKRHNTNIGHTALKSGVFKMMQLVKKVRKKKKKKKTRTLAIQSLKGVYLK